MVKRTKQSSSGGQSVACDGDVFLGEAEIKRDHFLSPSPLTCCSVPSPSVEACVMSFKLCVSLSFPHLLMRKPPIHLNLQANQRRRGQKYSKWNCWNSGVLRMSLRKAMSRSDSVSMIKSSRRANSSPMVTRNRRNTLRINLFSSSTSFDGDGLLLSLRGALLPWPNSAPCPSFSAPASDSFSSSMLQGEPLRWRAKGISTPCSATGVGSKLSEGL